jgi:hypothetical protein
VHLREIVDVSLAGVNRRLFLSSFHDTCASQAPRLIAKEDARMPSPLFREITLFGKDKTSTRAII